MGYRTTTVRDAVLAISNNKYLLPAIQREFVWGKNPERIENLFDSILSGYPFGSMLFWQYKPENNMQYKFYEFIREFHEARANHNREHDLKGKSEITGVLDGQQRLTALYLGLKGHITMHIPRKSWNKDESFETKRLYIDLLYKKDELEDEDIQPDFQVKFKTEKQVEAENNSDRHFWFLMGNVLNWTDKKSWKETKEIKDKIEGKNNKFNEEQKENLREICDVLYDNLLKYDLISYYEEDTDSPDRILNIFVRVNSGGMTLHYADFLMSVIVSQWPDARNKISEIVDAIQRDSINMSRDVFLQCCLYLTGASLRFKVDNFKRETIQNIQENFHNIEKYIKNTCSILKQLNYHRGNLKTPYVVLPLALFLKTNNCEKVDTKNLERIRKWIQLSILNRTFRNPVPYLNKLRREINWKGNFPLEQIIQLSNSIRRNMNIDEESLESLMKEAQKGSEESWALLSLMYPFYKSDIIDFHEDHIYPYSKLNNDQRTNGGDFVANLQLLKGQDNREKSNILPEEWIKRHCKDDVEKIRAYKRENFIPEDLELTMENFEVYIEKRTALIKDKILSELQKEV